MITDAEHPESSVAGAPPGLRHQPALDGLRGLAVAGVLLFHGGHLTGGYLGVDAFFVLSGFLITTLLLVEHGTSGRISLSRFWSRRARRLLPALVCVIAAVAVYAAFIAQRGELPTVRGDALATMFYFANWHAIFSSGDYFTIFQSPSPLQHTWSLAIEEQFYLVWPLVLVVFLRRGFPAKIAAKRVLVLSLVLAFCSGVIAQVWYNAADQSRVYYGTDTRAAAILLGAALAAALAAWGPVRGVKMRRVLEASAIAACAFLALAWTHLSGTSTLLYRGGLLACGVAVTVVIAAGVHPTRGPVATALSFKPLCALGVISYGVYLWHWPIFVWCNNERTGLSGWPLFLVQCAITLAVALASYRFVERPIRYGWGTPRVMSWAVPATAVVLVVALLAATSNSSLPVIAAWVPGSRTVPSPDDANWHRALAHVSQLAYAKPNKPRVLVFGDSIALTLSSQTPTGQYNGANMKGFGLGLIGCSFLPETLIVQKATYQLDPNCQTWPTLLRQTIAAYRPRVVAVMLGPWEMFDRETSGGRENAGSPQLTDELERAMRRFERIVADSGARLVILTTPCYEPPPTRGAYGVVWSDKSRVAWLNRVWRATADGNGHTQVRNLSGLLCPGGEPIERSVGDRYRVDGMHFTPAGAKLVWHWLDRHVAPSIGRAN